MVVVVGASVVVVVVGGALVVVVVELGAVVVVAGAVSLVDPPHPAAVMARPPSNPNTVNLQRRALCIQPSYDPRSSSRG